MNNFSFSHTSEQRMEGVHPNLIAVMRLALSICPIDFGIAKDGGVRTAERQHELFLDKKSKADGYEEKSNHQPKEDGYGYAIDVYAYVEKKASWSYEHLTIIAGSVMEAARRLGYKVTWGGWWPWDKPHFQLEI